MPPISNNELQPVNQPVEIFPPVTINNKYFQAFCWLFPSCRFSTSVGKYLHIKQPSSQISGHNFLRKHSTKNGDHENVFIAHKFSIQNEFDTDMEE